MRTIEIERERPSSSAPARPGPIERRHGGHAPRFSGWARVVVGAWLLSSVLACGRAERVETRTRAGATSPSTATRSEAHPVLAPAATTPSVPGGPSTGVLPANHPLTTAEIVAGAEPSVALLVGRQGSGSGFLVGRGCWSPMPTCSTARSCRTWRCGSLGPRTPARTIPRLVDQGPARDLAFLAVPADLPPLELARGHVFRKGGASSSSATPAWVPNRSWRTPSPGAC